MTWRAVRLVAGKEWRESFNSPMPYVFMTVFFLLQGWFFISTLFLMGQASLEDFFGPMPLLLVFFLPAFTMRLFSEEYKSGTIEMLSTWPLGDVEIVAGKYLAALLMWSVTLAIAGFYAVLLCALGRPDVGQLLAGFFGAFLVGALYAAAGLFASSLTRSQVVSFVLGFLFSFAVFLAGKAAHLSPGPLGAWLTFLGVDSHFEPFLRGVIDSRDLVYFISGTALFLAAGLSSFNSRRWR